MQVITRAKQRNYRVDIMKLRKGDLVIVTTGDDAGVIVPTGERRPVPRKVLQIVDGGKKVVVEGANRVYKHVKRGHPKSPQGGRLSLEMPIDSAKVMFYCEACGRGVRLGYRYKPDGAKERFCKVCSRTVGAVSPPKSRSAAAK
jgi:large subunit ribosomal protein L24